MEIPVKVHRLPRVLIYVLVAVLCAAGLAAAHGSRIVDNWHVPQWEDSMFFQYNKNEIHSLWDCFVKRGAWGGLYRPLTTNLYYYVGGIALGNRIEAYHFINVVFVVLNAVLLYRLATLWLGAWWAMIPAVLFASRLALVEVVLHTCEFQGLVYVFFTILSVEFFVRSRLSDSSWLLALSALAFCLDLISKESAVVLPAMLIVYGRLLGGRFVLRPYLVHPMIALSWWILFVLVLRHHQPSGFDYDWSVSNVLRDYAGYFLDFSNWLIAPLGDYIMPAQVAALAGTFYMRLLLGVLIVSEIALLLFPRLLKTRDLRLAAFGFAWFLIATLPFAIFKGRLFMRYSYLGHAGLALCVGALVRGAIGLFRTRQPVALPQVSETIQVA
ncbi:MAG TPA: hypothetical protein VJX68_13040 [Candidatus Binatus sp.]|uniref:hypothetical protein n=1 Tax=Candidatus Binatus sp. TaxID=2811406 RepID=UPI002B46B2DD|nr:hypothetical protein [Candidatus Binatus sp.]HKN14109.1 hypothetical protein [Candidatus Binatus sp.]